MKPLRSAAISMTLVLSMSVVSEGGGSNQPERKPISQQVTIELRADGRFDQTTVLVSQNIGAEPLTHYSFFGSWNTLKAAFGEDGQALEYTVRKESDGFRVRVDLRQPVEPGERVKLRLVDRDVEVYLGKNGVYAYGKNHWPGAEIDYEERIIVHPALRLLYCEPEPESTSRRDGKIVLVYRRQLRADESFKCRILYQPGGSGASDGEQTPAPDGGG
jgi:hypothetical protein